MRRMHYVIKISSEDEKKIKNLIKKGSVIDVEHFLEVAIRNQFILEGENINFLTSFKPGLKSKHHKPRKRKILEKKYDLNDFLKRENLSIELLNVETEEFHKSLLWGQIYRIFPLKFNLRILANLLHGKGEYISLEIVKEVMTDLACQMGENLRNLDVKLSNKRSGKLATGFPTDAYGKLIRSRERYLNHYMGYLKGGSKVDGSLAQLGLVKIKANGESGLIGITEMGLNFAYSENPIIDHQKFNVSLSSEEISQFLLIIKKNLPYERKHIIHFMSALESGINQRELLNEELLKFYRNLPEGTVKWDSPQVVNTMRTGITSRLFEMGLINVQYVGKRAKYKLKTEKWQELLN